jgi:hypothetical protein
MNKKAKNKKKRSKQYENKLKIHGTFDDAIKVLVMAEPSNEKPKK